MSEDNTQPSTLDGIKRLAKSIKVERSIQHVRALDEAARSVGFQNFSHARNTLHDGSGNPSKSPRHKLFLTVYWRENKSNPSGRETLTLWLSSPWADLIRPAQLNNHRALARFRPEVDDHLAWAMAAKSQSAARREICAAARTLQFIDTTKLRPSKSHSRAYPEGKSRNAVPRHDHGSVWYDSKTKRYLTVDEPYELAAEGGANERNSWSQRYCFTIVKPSWAGMYDPDGGSRLYLISDGKKGIPLEPIAAALSQLPPPIVEASWNGESAPSLPIFISPGKRAAPRLEKLPEKAARAANNRSNTVGYVQMFVGPRRRPNARMPVEVHAKVGSLLKSVLVASSSRRGVYNRVDTVRSELDEWAQKEYTSRKELPDGQFFDLYYHELNSSSSRSQAPDERTKHIAALEHVKQIVAEHYPDCPPLRHLQKNLDASISSLKRWVH
jgi:Domain of unknown function (DUF5623)